MPQFTSHISLVITGQMGSNEVIMEIRVIALYMVQCTLLLTKHTIVFLFLQLGMF